MFASLLKIFPSWTYHYWTSVLNQTSRLGSLPRCYILCSALLVAVTSAVRRNGLRYAFPLGRPVDHLRVPIDG
jgi:hypothetical protein